MGTKTILALASRIADKTGLERPQTLFGSNEGDESPREILRELEWTCHFLGRHFPDWTGYTAGSVGADKDGGVLGLSFTKDTDIAWPDDELLITAVTYRVDQDDGVGDIENYSDFMSAMTDLFWDDAANEDDYSTTDTGMP